MRFPFILVSLTLAAGACGKARGGAPKEPAKSTVAADARPVPEVACDAVVPAELREKFLPGRTVTHERSCHDGTCFADTCRYERDGQAASEPVHILYDCRQGVENGMTKTRAYFTTARMTARPIRGLGGGAVLDAEGLTFFDEDAACLVTLRAGGDEEEFLTLARAIEKNLSAATLHR